MTRRLLSLFALPAMIAAPASAQDTAALRIDPRLLIEAAEVWRVIATPRNPIWPGWDATGTPLLFYRTGVQDVLMNHPNPPDGFRLYSGTIAIPGARAFTREGATIMPIGGQNTSTTVNGVRTLVVADPEGPANPYDEMGTIAHEAFHVFQDVTAPDKGANEMALVRYPVLSVDNNVGFALEGSALADALRASTRPALRAAAVRWLAARERRRALLPAAAIDYEDGVEFSEGLAKYVQWRLLDCLQGTTPGLGLAAIPGFHGYADLTAERAAMVDMLLRNMRGQVAVNDAPYGTAPLRMRLYWSGMAIGAMLDRLSPGWKAAIMRPDTSLTTLARAAIRATPGELERALAALGRAANEDSIRAVKADLARRGTAQADSLRVTIETGPGTGVIVDYGNLADPRVGLSFTPFGITAIDSVRTIFAEVPIGAHFPNGASVEQAEALALLQDKRAHLIRFRLQRELSEAEFAAALATDAAPFTLALPGVRVSAPRAEISRDGRDLRIVLR